MTGTAPQASDLRQLSFYASAEHPCSYLPGRQSLSLFADPTATVTNTLYSQLAPYGFRRSGPYLYRPACPRCDACVPVRIPVAEFHARRNHRRCVAHNQDLRVRAVEPGHYDEHFRLYRRYMAHRHSGGGMDDPDPRRYTGFLTSAWSDTRFYEFRHANELLAVAVVDHLDDALSAVYTYYDPDCPARGLGTYAILWQIQEARHRGYRWLYLGYWIRECAKMRYKDQFRPFEVYRGGSWQRPIPCA
ncbi:MAG: arginyltransferase [Chromatiales bacterium 21-64-14]|nr:MAG: arginyltransferase [Chromatiales bacterium 21-64-14]HQU16413.1 arginyltransferase [Gammaproteobacteria bacterium]